MEKVPLEYSSLYKFLVSVGVFVLLADGLFVWAMLQLSAVLTFPEENLVELTESGSKSVETQQQYLTFLISQTPLIALAILIVGLGLTIWGLALWQPKQKVQDELERAQLADAVQKMTEAEVAAAAVVEAAQDIAEESVDVEAVLRAEQYAERYSALERRIASVFESAFVSTHSVETEVKLTKNGIAVAYIDLLLTARDPKKLSYVVEVKAAREMLSDIRLDRAQLATGQSAIVAASLLGREVRGIVFVVLTAENAGDGLVGDSRPIETDDPRNKAGTFMVTYDILLRWENLPDGLRRFIEG